MTTKDYYTEAVKDLLAADQSAKHVSSVLKNLERVLELRGHTKLYVPILRAVKRELPKDASHRAVLTVADSTPSEIKVQQKALKDHNLETEDPIIAVDDTIIGGFRLKTVDKITDGSYKSKLVELYRAALS